MEPRVLSVLFLCTGNSARSIIAEAILNRSERGRIRAFSAGSHPVGKVHPLALDTLRRARIPTDGLRSKDWSEFAQPGAPDIDIVLTVCDNAAQETCPVWPGNPVTAHWGIPDPAQFVGTEEARSRAFDRALHQLSTRIGAFLELPLDQLEPLALARALREIGKTPD